MVVMLYTNQLFILIEEIEEEPDSNKDKAKYLNRVDKAHGHLLSSVSRDLQFLSKLCDLSCELCACPQIYVLNLIWY